MAWLKSWLSNYVCNQKAAKNLLKQMLSSSIREFSINYSFYEIFKKSHPNKFNWSSQHLNNTKSPNVLSPQQWQSVSRNLFNFVIYSQIIEFVKTEDFSWGNWKLLILQKFMPFIAETLVHKLRPIMKFLKQSEI